MMDRASGGGASAAFGGRIAEAPAMKMSLPLRTKPTAAGPPFAASGRSASIEGMTAVASMVTGLPSWMA